jgi:hypothetical protein
VSAALDAIVLQGLARDPADRFETAFAFAMALENACAVASQSEVAAWVKSLVGDMLEERAMQLRRFGREGGATRQQLITQPDLRANLEASDSSEGTPRPSIGEPVGQAALTASPPSTRASRWLVPALVVLLLCVVVAVDAVRQRSVAEAKTPASVPGAQSDLESTPASVRRQIDQLARVRADEPRSRTGPQPTVQALVDSLPHERNGAVSRQAAGRATVAGKPSSRPRTTPRRASVANRNDVSPADMPGKALGSATDCAQAFELETVDGVVVKTFKPGCLQ